MARIPVANPTTGTSPNREMSIPTLVSNINAADVQTYIDMAVIDGRVTTANTAATALTGRVGAAETSVTALNSLTATHTTQIGGLTTRVTALEAGGGGGGLTQEQAEDIVGSLVQASGTGITVVYDDAANALRIGLAGESYTTVEKAKLAAIATAATANATDAALRDRTTHTGAQAIATVSGLQTALDAKVTGTGINTIVALTQAQYDALGTKVPTTLYTIVD